jgi:hypothetical protein
LTVIENKKPNGRIYLSIVESYRGPETKKVRQRNGIPSKSSPS